ncbi:MAG TPA: hypothetical protein VMM78_13350 [Thermomicrobiales bacterium]|nr:hypothetical protein [Thermomicrobiales bacterium]
MSALFSGKHAETDAGAIDVGDGEDHVLSHEVMSYCVSAVPAAYVFTEDLIIRDFAGRSFLLTSDATDPAPLTQSELNVLGMAYEPAQDTSWHTAEELRRMFFRAREG